MWRYYIFAAPHLKKPDSKTHGLKQITREFPTVGGSRKDSSRELQRGKMFIADRRKKLFKSGATRE
jgi:hypothetical protein